MPKSFPSLLLPIIGLHLPDSKGPQKACNHGTNGQGKLVPGYCPDPDSRDLFSVTPQWAKAAQTRLISPPSLYLVASSILSPPCSTVLSFNKHLLNIPHNCEVFPARSQEPTYYWQPYRDQLPFLVTKLCFRGQLTGGFVLKTVWCWSETTVLRA